MENVINDTNIFLDLYDIGLLDDFFQLPIRVHTVDFVINEITRPDQQKVIQQLINKGILFVKDYPATGIPNPYQLNQKCGANLTLTDSTVIYYVQSLAECRIQIPLRSLHFLVEIMTAFNIESKLSRFYTTIYWKDGRQSPSADRLV